MWYGVCVVCGVCGVCVWYVVWCVVCGVVCGVCGVCIVCMLCVCVLCVCVCTYVFVCKISLTWHPAGLPRAAGASKFLNLLINNVTYI